MPVFTEQKETTAFDAAAAAMATTLVVALKEEQLNQQQQSSTTQICVSSSDDLSGVEISCSFAASVDEDSKLFNSLVSTSEEEDEDNTNEEDNSNSETSNTSTDDEATQASSAANAANAASASADEQAKQAEVAAAATTSETPAANAANASNASADQEQTAIIFDWDDTLLASSFLSAHGYRLDTDMERKETYEFVKNELKTLETCIINLFNEAIPRGKVHIITNAETGWVELSAQKFLPNVVPYLSKVTVISARSSYEHLFPEAPVKWKFSAMQDSLSQIINNTNIQRKNIISFGDSHVEREAVRAVTRGVANARTKSIKFAECPSTEQLRKQLELVTNCFHYILTHEGDLDLMLKMSVSS